MDRYTCFECDVFENHDGPVECFFCGRPMVVDDVIDTMMASDPALHVYPTAMAMIAADELGNDAV